MDLGEYQRLSTATDQRPEAGLESVAVHLLGLAGEAGSVAAEYKKKLRDGDAHAFWKLRIREELGDTLWYLAALATHFDLDLDEIARANLDKTRNRWAAGRLEPLDLPYPAEERLPRAGRYEFRPTTSPTDRPAMTIWFDGQQVGSLLTDASPVEDGYRYHDAFHLSYAVLLGWSPVTRALLGCKRRSNPAVDENEDGGRAVVIEEAISALVFAYASQHRMLENIDHVDQRLLDSIEMLASGTEVGLRTQADWERAILAGFQVFRDLRKHDGGAVHFDADAAVFRFETAPPESHQNADLVV